MEEVKVIPEFPLALANKSRIMRRFALCLTTSPLSFLIQLLPQPPCGFRKERSFDDVIIEKTSLFT